MKRKLGKQIEDFLIINRIQNDTTNNALEEKGLLSVYALEEMIIASRSFFNDVHKA